MTVLWSVAVWVLLGGGTYAFIAHIGHTRKCTHEEHRYCASCWTPLGWALAAYAGGVACSLMAIATTR